MEEGAFSTDLSTDFVDTFLAPRRRSEFRFENKAPRRILTVTELSTT